MQGREVNGTSPPSADVRNVPSQNFTPSMCLRGMDREIVTFYRYFIGAFGFKYSGSSAVTTSLNNPSCSPEFRKAFKYENRIYSS